MESRPEELFSTFGEPEGQNSYAVVSASDPLVKEDGLIKHVEYRVSGQDQKGNFEVYRRYKDFKVLRSILVQNWGGCYVPQIPPKQMIVSST